MDDKKSGTTGSIGKSPECVIIDDPIAETELSHIYINPKRLNEVRADLNKLQKQNIVQICPNGKSPRQIIKELFGVNAMDNQKVIPMCGYDATKEDVVNHPKHYKTGKIECIKCISAVVNMYDGEQAYDVGQVIKYLYRAPTKMNFMQDLKKAQWYLNRLIKIASKENK